MLGAALGSDLVKQFGEEAGLSDGQAGPLLAGILPELVNQLSPNGREPAPTDLGSLVGGLLQGFARS